MEQQRVDAVGARPGGVDVVIVTYRSSDVIEACLRSVPSWVASVVVVENASGDASADLAEALGVTVVRNAENVGFARAANQGARLGTAEHVLFLNPDALLNDDALAAMVGETLDESVAVVGAELVRPDGTHQRSLWPYPSAVVMWREAVGLARLAAVPEADCFVVGAAFLVRRRCFQALEGFDERYWLYGEETDLCYRARRRGWRVVRAQGARVTHVGGGSDTGHSELVTEHFLRGSDRFVLDHRGKASLVSYRVAGLVGTLVRLPLLWVADRSDRRVVHRARQARRTWDALRHYPTEVHGAESIGRRQLLVLSLEAWDDTWRRNQFLVRELLDAHPDIDVLFVEPPRDVLHDLRRGTGLFTSRRTSMLRADGRLVRFRPTKWLPRVLWPRVDRSLVAQARRAARTAGFSAPTVWMNDSTYAPLVNEVGWRVVYDITDDWLDAAVAPRERRRRTRREMFLMATADEVVVCSPELARRRRPYRGTHLIPNAVDASHFRTPQVRPADVPAGRYVVYVGSLHEDRLDVALVTALADARPDLGVVLVGPDSLHESSRSQLRAAGVQLLGARPYASVPGYLQHAAAIVVPHVVTAFTESLDPIKAYECLAVGVPTIATPVAGFRDLTGVVVADRSVFVDRLAELLAESRPAAPQSVPSWADRAGQFSEVLDGAAAAVDGPETRLRVVYLGHCAQLSGAELALARLLPALEGVRPHVILAEDGPLVARLVRDGIPVEVLPMAERARDVKRDRVVPGRLPLAAIGSTAVYVWRLTKRLRELRPDVVHTNSLKAAVYGSLAGRLAGVPVVMHVRDRIADDYLPGPAVFAIRLLARLLPDVVVANSNATLATLGRRIGASAVVPSPVVLRDPVVQKELDHASGSALVVGIVGRLAPWKGQDVFLRAFAEAFPTGAVRALIVGGALFGEDAYREDLEALVTELGIGERVEFTGHVDDVGAELQRMDVVVHASVIAEPFGQVVVEAMAAGRAVVASAAGGPLEVIDDGVNGVLVPPLDVAALAVAMRHLVDDDVARQRLGAQAVVRAASFRPERIAPDVVRLYRRLSAAEA